MSSDDKNDRLDKIVSNTNSALNNLNDKITNLKKKKYW